MAKTPTIKPYIRNTPVWQWLCDNEARCDWQHRTQGTERNPIEYVEQWRFPNHRTCIVTVRVIHDNLWWEIHTQAYSHGNLIAEVLSEASKALDLPGVVAEVK